MIPYVYPSEHYKAGEGLTSRNGHPLPAYECPEWVLTERHVRRAGWFATHPALRTVQGASDVSQYEAKTVALRTAMDMNIEPSN